MKKTWIAGCSYPFDDSTKHSLADSFSDALTGVKINLDMRLRYEYVDQDTKQPPTRSRWV